MRGLFEIEVTALLAEAALGRHAFHHGDAVHLVQVLEAVARQQQLRVVLQHFIGQEHRHFFFDQRVRADGVAGGQHQAIAGQRDLRPQHAGRIDQDSVFIEVELLLLLGHCRLVAHFGHALFQQCVHQGRLADVGDPHDHDAQRLGRHAAVRRQRLGQVRNARHVARFLGRHRVCGHAFLGVVVGAPGGGGVRVGQVDLVEDFQAWPLAELAQLFHHRIGAGLGQAGVDHFDHQIGVLHLLRRLLLGGVHMPRIPLDCHAVAFKIDNLIRYFTSWPRRSRISWVAFPISS